MIDQLVVVDNFFSQEQLNEVLNDAASCDYWIANEHPYRPQGGILNWDGIRSRSLLDINKERYSSIISDAITKSVNQSFGDNPSKFSFNWKCRIYFHKLNEEYKDSWAHRDLDTIFAGVIYLNENPPANTGTTIITQSGIQQVENMFNRLVMYNGNNPHYATNGFKDRLTITFFISAFTFNFWNEIHKEH
jgi:hypothetical protein